MITDDKLNDLIAGLTIEELRDLKSRFSTLIFERICFLTSSMVDEKKINRHIRNKENIYKNLF